MMGQAVQQTGVSVEDYLAGEKVADVRHEYINGQVFAMVGTSKAHNLIALNLGLILRQHLKGSPCRVYLSDVKVHIRRAQDERFYYPDLFVECGKDSGDPYYSDEPVLIVEVLSNSTERADRAEKLDAYRQLPSLQDYLLVAQDRPRVEVFSRDSGWSHQVFGAGDAFRLNGLGLTVSLAEVYESVALMGEETP